MKRRELVTLLGGAAALAPFAARAQQPGRTYRLGFLTPTRRNAPAIDAFFDELSLNGFVEGNNVAVIPGGFGVRNEELAEHAAAIVAAAPDAIVCGPDLPLRAVQAATKTIPLIAMTEDMVGAGLVASLARPGGNTTGISILSPELNGKRLGLLMEAVPGARRIVALADSRITPPQHLQELRDAARARDIELSVIAIAKPEEIVSAIEAAKAANAEALNFLATPLFGIPGNPNIRVVIEQVAKLRVPAMHQWPETVEEGGLLAYGARFTELYRQRERMVVKVLRGAKAADLPIEQPTRFELVINLKTAKAIGHEIPAALVLRADKVIE
jgi:putative ABC transport system substrate-binding protein